ncbi:hypothetical protein RyT2_17560 [Pseudolactococcus yaeyamensis]
MKKIAFEKPIGLQIEITGKCNLVCKHCYNSSGDIGKYDISDQVWIKFFEDFLTQYSVSNINISGGEPLLRKKVLLSIIEKIQQNNKLTKVVIMTNGYFITDKFLKELQQFQNPIEFQVSLDGANKASHEIVRIVEGSWEKSIDACINIVNHGFKLGIASTVTTQNILEIEDLFELSVAIGAHSLTIGPAVKLGRSIVDSNHLILNDESEKNVRKKLNSLKNVYDDFLNIIVTSSVLFAYKNYSEIEPDWFLVNHRGGVKIDSCLPYIVGNITTELSVNLWQTVLTKYRDVTFKEIIKNALKTDTIISNIYEVSL